MKQHGVLSFVLCFLYHAKSNIPDDITMMLSELFSQMLKTLSLSSTGHEK